VVDVRCVLEDMGLLEELENAGVNTGDPLEAFNALHGAERCEFAMRLANAIDVSCANCMKLGFPLCEIECTVPCEECVRYEVCESRRESS